MEFVFLGWPADGPQLRLDYRVFPYAGKFVMTTTGKTIAREGELVCGAVCFNEDRTTPDRSWIRYVTVRRGRRGERVGPRLVSATTKHLHEAGYSAVAIAVNNPYAYVAMHRAGFGFSGDTTGIAEVVLTTAAAREPARFRAGMAVLCAQARPDPPALEYVAQWMRRDPPDLVNSPDLVVR